MVASPLNSSAASHSTPSLIRATIGEALSLCRAAKKEQLRLIVAMHPQRQVNLVLSTLASASVATVAPSANLARQEPSSMTTRTLSVSRARTSPLVPSTQVLELRPQTVPTSAPLASTPSA